MKKIKKVVDERQELEILKVEHLGFWIMFWLLFISIIVKTTMGMPFKQFGVEFGVFMIGCIFTIIASLRKGAWDAYTKPCIKTYLLYSIAGTIIVGILFGVTRYLTMDYFRNNIQHLIIATCIFSLSIFVLVFIALYLTGQYAIKRQKQLEKKYKD
jgi:uncharacterized membrane protein